MRAYKCDSCGNLFANVPIEEKHFYVKDLVKNNFIDLCPKCNEKLNRLIGNQDEEEEENDESQGEF